MKLSTVAAILFALTPVALLAQAGAMPPHEPGAQTGAAMSMPAKPPVKPSKFLTITFDGHVTTLSVEDLFKLPQQTITVMDGHTGKSETFSGPLVADVLAKAGLAAEDRNHALILHSSVVATGTDSYFVLYSAAELEPMFSSGKAIVAIMQTGLPVPSGIELVNPLDAKPARWVHGLTSLAVMSVAPTR